MPLGEAPITSYFARAPKRKKNPASPAHTPPEKRKRVEEEAPVVQTLLPFTKASRKTKPARTTPDGTDRKPRWTAAHKATTHISPVPNLPSSSTRSRTPPLIDLTSPEPKRKGRASVEFVTPPLRFHDILNSSKNPTNLNNHPDAISTSIPQPDDITSPNPTTSPLPDGFDDSVPSSQSQHYFPWESPPRRTKPASVDVVPSSQSQHLPPPTAEPVERGEDGFVVPSSQSQWLLPMEGDPTTDPVEQDDDDLVVPSSQSQWLLPMEPEPVEPEDDSFVPSSQSQWLLPMEGAAVSSPEIDPDDEIIPSSQSHLETELIPRSGYKPPRRASLQSSLPPSDLDIDVADMFEGPLPVTPAVREDKDDSATESDDDVPAVPPRPSEPAQPSALVHDEYSLQYELGSYTARSLPDDGFSGGTSEESLPGAVKDFFDMVGSSEGSYPSGFPESLRGKWSCDATQVE
ncbi:hypothetical protein DFH08DRAFT_12957 [Mycena albidolilacea]|uniref:Uncharacterized protein n=1 Tax=Mycena albidolilacea TaxID=1033008 RepID=A0AAD7AUR2_9AGAR|nr:hypothetical protein DFH08DRAFT_12957 [Mycena albidolilacea]